MSDYKIISKTEDASKERVFYTIEIAPFRFVDVMCIRNTSENYEYLIQNEDASYVYYELEYKYTYPGYPFDERKCLNLAAAQYAKDYYAKESIWDEIRSDYYDDEQEAWAIDAWKNCDGDQGKVIAHVGDDKRITYYSEEAKIDPYAQEIIREVLLRIDEANTQKEKWVLALSKKMTMNVPEEHKEYVKGFLFELFKKQPNNILKTITGNVAHFLDHSMDAMQPGRLPILPEESLSFAFVPRSLREKGLQSALNYTEWDSLPYRFLRLFFYTS